MAIFNNKVKAAVVFVSVVWLLYGRRQLWPTGTASTRFRGSGTVGGGGDLGWDTQTGVSTSRSGYTPGGG